MVQRWQAGRARLARSRPLRSVSALSLAFGAASTGLVVLAAPALAATAPTITASPVSPSKGTTPSWSFDTSGTDGSIAWQCSVDPQGTAPTTWSSCGSPSQPVSSYGTPLTTDGPYVFSVRQDVTSGATVATSAPYVLDREAVVSAAPAAPRTNIRTPLWVVQVEDGATATCSVDGDPVVPEPCVGSYTTASALSDGTHTLTVTAVDALLNTGTATATVVVDPFAPARPAPSGPASPTNARALTWTWAVPADLGTATCVLTADGTPTGQPCTSPTSMVVTTPAGTDVTYVLTVTLDDQAGNTSQPGSSTVLYDGTAPTAPVLLAPFPATTATTDRAPRWSFTSPGVSTSCALSGAGTVDLGDCSNGQAQATALTQGAWTLSVTTRDAAGNTSVLVAPQYVVDIEGPLAPVVRRPAVAGSTNGPKFTWTGETPVTAVCSWTGTTVLGAPVSGGPAACDAREYFPVFPAEGDYVVHAQLTDSLGNVGAVGDSQPFRYDTTAPAAPDLSAVPTDGQVAPDYGFAVEPGGSARCSVSPGVADTVCDAGTYRPTLSGEGSYTVTVVVRDAAGNTAAGTASFTLDTTAPAAVTVTAPRTPGSTRFPSWGLASPDGAALTCRLQGVDPAPRACDSGYLGNLTGSPDATYTLLVTATDRAGNTTVLTSPYELDTVRPAQPAVTGPPSPGNAADPAWRFALTTGETAQCRLVLGGLPRTWQACDGGVFTATGIADGVGYTVDVVVTDAAGNASVVGTSAPYTSDRTRPAAPVVAGLSGPSDVVAPVWTWTAAETGLTAYCRLDRDGTLGGEVRCDSGTFAPGTSGDATYVVSVRVVDAAGNSSDPGSLPAYELDTVDPAAPVVTGASGRSNAGSPVWDFPTEPLATVECSLVRGTVAGAFVPCVSGQSWPLSGDEDYSLVVHQTDRAGNRSPDGAGPHYLYDATLPAAPVVAAPASPSSARATSWTFAAEALSATRCRLLRDTLVVRDWADCTSPVPYDLTNLADAPYELQVDATDLAGNRGPAGRSQPYVLDTTAPDPALVTGPSGPSSVTSPTFTWTGETGARSFCRFVHDGVEDASGTACSSPYTPALTADGLWAVRVVLVDAAGNRSLPSLSPTYVLDSVAPQAPVVTAPASPGRDLAPSWSATVETGASTSCRLSSATTVVSDWAPCKLPVTTDLAGRPDGTYVLEVRATDAAGLTGPAASGSYELDTTAPAAPLFTTVPVTPGRTASPSFAFTAEPGATVSCRVTLGLTVLSTVPKCVSPLPVVLTGAKDGAYTVSVRATDAAGNTGAAQTATYVLDTTAPAAPVLVTGPASPSPDRTPTWTFTSEAGSTVTCRLVGAVSGVVVADLPCTSPYAAPSLPGADTYTFTVRAADAAGNTGAALVDVVVLDPTAPVTAEVTGPTSPGRVALATWRVSAPSGTIQCRLTTGVTVIRDWTACGPTYSANLAARGEGLYALAVRVVSGSRTSAEVVSTYLLDTTAPPLATITSPPSPSTDRNPIWSIASPDTGVTAECAVLDPSGTLLKAFAPCSVGVAGATYDLDLTGARDGGWTLVVRLTDAAGNTGADATSTYVLDTGSPTDVLITPPVSPSALETPVWRLTGDSDAVLECRLTGPGLTTTLFTPCAKVPGVPGAGTFTAALAGLDDGTFTLTVRSRDGAGNLGPERSSGYALDRQQPPPPTEPVGPPSPSRVGVVTWTWTLAAGTTAVCTLSSATTVVQPEQACSSPWTRDLTQLGDGDYLLTVRAVDEAGNRSAPVTSRYVLDSTPAAAPSIVAFPPSRSRDTTPTWGLRATSAGDGLECQLVGGAAPAWAACDPVTTFDLSPATSGTYVLRVRARDLAGNVSDVVESPSYVLDPNALLAPEVTPPSPQRSNGLAPVFGVRRQVQDVDTDHVLCEVRRFDSGPATATPCGFGSTTVDLRRAPALSGDADVVLAVRSVDATGRVSEPATALYRFDNVRPGAPVILPLAESSGFTGKVQWTFASTDPDDTFRCQVVRRGTAAPAEESCTSPYAKTLTATGDHTLSVWAVDVAGNRSAAPATSTYAFLAPVPTLSLLAGPTAGTDPTPTWTFAVPRGYTATCSLSDAGGAVLQKDVSCATGSYTAPLTGRDAGTYSLAVVLVDGRGNRGAPARGDYRLRTVVGNGTVVTPTVPRTDRPSTPTAPVPQGVLPTGTTTQRPPATVDRTEPRTVRPVVTASGPLTAGRIPARIDIARTPVVIGEAIKGLTKKPTIPLLLLSVVVGFLLLQNLIDRRDPKLASAPVGLEPELDFGPVLRRGAPA